MSAPIGKKPKPPTPDNRGSYMTPSLIWRCRLCADAEVGPLHTHEKEL